MRSDLQQIVNLTAATLRPDHARTLEAVLNPRERVIAIWSVPLMTATCLCMTSNRLIVVDGRKGDSVRVLDRDTDIQLSVVQSIGGFRAEFIAASGVMVVKTILKAEVPFLMSFMAAGQRDPAFLKPDPDAAPQEVWAAIDAAADYMETLSQILDRNGLLEEFKDIVLDDDTQLVEDHILRFFVVRDLALGLALSNKASTRLARAFYDATVEWFLSGADEPGYMAQLTSAMEVDANQELLRESRGAIFTLLGRLEGHIAPTELHALRVSRSAAFASLYRIFGLPIPVEDATPLAPVDETVNGPVQKARDLVARLETLIQMRTMGSLTEDEFAAAKNHLLQ